MKRTNKESFRPRVKKAVGQLPACLVNASVTYCGNNQVYAFGGFDQFTDEGKIHLYCCLNQHFDERTLILMTEIYSL